jgi:hypothetical protein
MKIVNLLLAALFLVFAWVQINDPDPWLWVALYVFMAGVFAFAAFGKKNKYVLLAGIAVCVIWTALLLPEFINWINMGMPTITGSMKAEEPHIEYTREFLGLFICIIALGALYLRKPKV